MDVEAPQPGHVEHPLRQDQPVGGNHHGIGAGRGDRFMRGGGVFGVFAVQPQAPGLGDRDAVAGCPLLDGGGLQLHAPAGGAVGLAQDQRNFKTGAMQPGKRHSGKFRSTGKNNTHGA